MLKADLHVHSKYSSDPEDAILKRFGTQESYTEVEEIYKTAKVRGMSFVTITDHNAMGGAAELVKSYPDEAFMGVELTTCFPENGCAVHVLVYDFTPQQFKQMYQLRPNIYKLRDYIREHNLPYSLAHATYSVNAKLTLEILEKLILLFDVFECINGTRVEAYNHLWKEVLMSMTPEKIKALRVKHNIEPFSDTPWVKGHTGGSDEHAGLFIGETWTETEGKTKEDFLNALRARKTQSRGASNNFKTQVYTFLKIAYHFSSRKKGSALKCAWDELCGVIFEGKSLRWKTQLQLKQLSRSKKITRRLIAKQANDLVRKLKNVETFSHREKVELVYKTMAGLEDQFFVSNFKGFQDAFAHGDVIKVISNLTATFRSFFLSLPFLGTFRHLYQSSALIDEVRREFLGPVEDKDRRILWFSDTVHDLNGVSFTLKNFATRASDKGLSINLVTTQQPSPTIPEHMIELPVAYEYVPDFYKTYTLRFPSLLKALEIIADKNPTEILVSTPGPVGLLGILAARLFGVPCRGIYHSDFTRMTELGLSGGTIASLVSGYIKWFYSSVNEIRVPTQEIIDLLVLRGYNPSKMCIFKRGIDTDAFSPVHENKDVLRQKYHLDHQMTLLYAGRVSRDKSLELLVDVYKKLLAQGQEVNLIFAGDGPMLDELKEVARGCSRITFTGRIDQQELAALYTLSDLFVFPSTMDTFGMAVLEAQSCGLPALVTNMGGPQEVIEPGKTGFVLEADDVQEWVDAVLDMKTLLETKPHVYQEMKIASRERVQTCYTWDEAMKDLFSLKR